MIKINKDENEKLTKFMRKTFGNAHITLKPRNNISDSVEVYIGDDFLGLLSKDIDEGETSYNFSMAILDIDLDDA